MQKLLWKALPAVSDIFTAEKNISGLIRFLNHQPLQQLVADYCLTLFSDLTRKVTMQNLFNDGGFSSMGMSARAMEMYNKSLDCRNCHEQTDNLDVFDVNWNIK